MILNNLVCFIILFAILTSRSLTAQTTVIPPYIKAIRSHDVTSLRSLITNRVTANAQGNEQWERPIFEALHMNDAEIVKLLIDAGADVNIRSDSIKSFYDTPLFFALTERHAKIIRLLINAGADRQGITPLCLAVLERDYDNIDRLLPDVSTEEIESRNLTGDSILRYAAPDRQILRKITQNRHFKTLTPLSIASMLNEADDVRKLIREVPPAQLRKESLSALQSAIQYGSLNAVQVLFETGMDVNVYMTSDMTPLCVAAKFGQLEIITWLLKKGADRTKLCDEVLLAEIIAKSFGYADCYKLLHDHN